MKTLKYLVSISLLLVSCASFAQVGRYDNTAQIVTSVNGVSLMAPAIGASVTVCTSPAVGGIASFGSGPCTNRASICPDSTGVACSTGAPNNPITADDQGNFGFWGASGTYQYTVCPTNGACQGPYYATIPGSGGSGAQGIPGVPGVPGFSPNQLLNGCGVAWTAGLSFTVSPCSYLISNTQYSSILSNITLATADPSNDRIDVIAVDNTGAVITLTGIPSVNPVPPSVDLSSQLQVTFVSVPAGALVPANVVVTDIYHENAEWTCATSANFNCASTSNPHQGTKDIEATAAATANFARLTIPAGTIDLSTRNNLVFWIRSKAVWPSTRAVTLQWYNGTTAKCTPVLFKDGVFTFSSSNTTAYQQIVIPTSVFNCAGIPVTRLQFTVAGTGTNLGFYLDDIQLQGGVANTSTFTGLIDRGLWSATTAYVPHDFVFWNGGSWYAIAPSTNSAPTVTNTNWFSVGAVSPFISQSANPAQSGPIRLANNEGIAWRNFANTGDCILKLDASNQYSFDACGFSFTELDFTTEVCSSATVPAAGHATVCADTATGLVCAKDSAGVLHCPAASSTASTLRTCSIQVGDGTNTVVTADYAPFKTASCKIPYAATIVEIDIQTDAGTPSILLERRRGAATLADLLSGALPAAGTTTTCALTGTSGTCIDGTTSSGSITLSNTALSAGDVIEVKSGTASTETSARISVVFTVN